MSSLPPPNDDAPKPPTSLRTISALTLFVENLPAAKDFYTSVFEAPVLFEDATSCAVRFSNLIVNLLLASDATASQLIDPEPVGGPGAARRFQLSVWVDDLDPVYEELVMRGVTAIQGPTLRPWGMRTLSFTDPAGHCWEVAQHVKQ